MAVTTVILLVRTVFWLSGTVYVCGGIFSPAWLGRSFSLEAWFNPVPLGLEDPKKSLWRFLVGPVIVIGVGVFIYYAIYPLIDIIPYDWGGRDEDGEWQPLRDDARNILTFFGALFIVGSHEKTGTEAARAARRSLLEERKGGR